MNRHPRDGIRERWARAIVTAEIGNAAKVLLLHLVVSGRVTPRGAVTFNRDDLAAEIGIHPQRISTLVREARQAGLLDRCGGGWKGQATHYEVLMPTPLGAAS